MGDRSDRLKNLACWNAKCYEDSKNYSGESPYKFRVHIIDLKKVICKCCGDVFTYRIDAFSYRYGVKNEPGKRQWRIKMEKFHDALKEALRMLLCPDCKRDYKKRRRRNIEFPLFETLHYKIKNYGRHEHPQIKELIN